MRSDGHPVITRRRALRDATVAGLGMTALGGSVEALLARAADAAPHAGSLKDIEHVVILMQENRSFDHYFGTLSGVRGFGDKRGRKAFFQADRLRRFEAAPEQALRVYQAALPKWLDFLLAHRAFARISSVQEETYETQMRYLRVLQGQRDAQLTPLVTGLAQLALTIPVPLAEAPTYKDEKAKVIPIRQVRGPFEEVYVPDWPEGDALARPTADEATCWAWSTTRWAPSRPPPCRPCSPAPARSSA